jgi:hypothetical protein
MLDRLIESSDKNGLYAQKLADKQVIETEKTG